MTWRNQTTHREETKAVKEALVKAGFQNVHVGHDRGTAWSWLKIRCDPKPEHKTWQDKRIEVIRIAKAVTGRSGDYDGEILVE